jgi:hypothetical protein
VVEALVMTRNQTILSAMLVPTVLAAMAGLAAVTALHRAELAVDSAVSRALDADDEAAIRWDHRWLSAINDINEVGRQTGACQQRTDYLRATLEVLIGVWPGRARLPEPEGDWPAWPTPGVNLERR